MSKDALQALRLELGRRAAIAVDRALAVEPAGSLPEPWRQLLESLQVTPLPEQQRYASVQRDRFHRGAPTEELRACLEAISGGARHELAGLSVDDALRHRAHGLLDAVVEQTLARYRDEAAAAPAGGMFGFAMASAQRKAAARAPANKTYALRCPHCGAVRLRPEDLRCEFCDGKTTLA